MTQLKGNEDYLCINQSVNIFDVISCKEEQASQIIAWLLNPREAHGFRKQVTEQLLTSISDDGKNVCGYKGTKAENISIANILKHYQDVVIQTEYAIKVDNKGLSEANKRIDILLCIETPNDDNYLIIIENKYGCKEHSPQTKVYFDYFSKKYCKYKCIYIYMDIYDYHVGENPISGNQNDIQPWNLVNYEWLIEFLKKHLNGRTPVDNILKDIYIEFSGNDEEEGYFSAFFNQKQKLLQSFGDCKGIDKYKIGEDDDIAAYNYSSFYDALNSCAVFEKFIAIENNICNLNNTEYLCNIRRTKMYLIPRDIYDKWKQKWYDNNQRGDWPIYCTLTYDDEKNKLTAQLEIWLKNLDCFINKRELTKRLKEDFSGKKNIIIPQDLSGCHQKESDKLVKFINKHLKLFDIIRDGKYE